MCVCAKAFPHYCPKCITWFILSLSQICLRGSSEVLLMLVMHNTSTALVKIIENVLLRIAYYIAVLQYCNYFVGFHYTFVSTMQSLSWNIT